jgi:putative ABC transport system permease protein
LLICCLNVANLVRARNDGRAREFGLRWALGAGRSRLFRQLAIEGMLIGGAAALAGLALAPPTGRYLLQLVPGAANAYDLDPDPAILLATTALALAAAFLAVVLPAWRTSVRHFVPGSGARVSDRWNSRRAMVATQLATALVLLVVAGMCLSTVRRLQSVPLGFDPSAVLSIEASLPKGTAADEAVRTIERVRAGLAASPLIDAASYASPGVYADNSGTSMGVVPAEYVPRPGEDTLAGVIIAGPDFFEVIRLPIREGRTFDAGDVGERRRVVLVNEAFARKYYGDRSPIGARVRTPNPEQPVISEIIGLVRDARHYGVRSDVWPMVYLPAACVSCGSDRHQLLIRTRGSVNAGELRAAIEGIDARVQVENVRSLGDGVAEVISGERLLATLTGVVAVVAIALAALGLYGLLAYGVSRRRTEFGIRLALGASPRDIHRLVLGETFWIAGIGTFVGGAISLLAARLMERVLTHPAPFDWRLVPIAAIGLLAVALLAGTLPARRAAHADPARTLRAE